MSAPYYEQDGITIYHGDCREVSWPAADLVLTDPPYGIALQEHGRNGYDWSIAGDGDQSLGVAVLERCASIGLATIAFAHCRKPWPGDWRQFLVWDKGPAVGGGGDIKTCWKFTWELVQVARTGTLNFRRDSAVLRFYIERGNYHLHPCQKPLDLLRYLIGKASAPGAVVFDPFMGCGSTLVAAKDLGRRAVGIEVEERYCEIAARRLSQCVLDFGGAA
jgi:DNA modification methylase